MCIYTYQYIRCISNNQQTLKHLVTQHAATPQQQPTLANACLTNCKFQTTFTQSFTHVSILTGDAFPFRAPSDHQNILQYARRLEPHGQPALAKAYNGYLKPTTPSVPEALLEDLHCPKKHISLFQMNERGANTQQSAPLYFVFGDALVQAHQLRGCIWRCLLSKGNIRISLTGLTTSCSLHGHGFVRSVRGASHLGV